LPIVCSIGTAMLGNEGETKSLHRPGTKTPCLTPMIRYLRDSIPDLKA